MQNDTDRHTDMVPTILRTTTKDKVLIQRSTFGRPRATCRNPRQKSCSNGNG